MRTTGMARKVDNLGRVVLPSEMRKSFGIREGDFLDISVEDDRIILAKREASCIFCRARDDLKEFRGRLVCATCITELTGGGEDRSSWDLFTEPD
ncbi:MAG TPA: AbrB/MazE/SpoVT family DNA-binding domain-containing protein [Actinomycetota bacterium]|nr:AbrB/MazE/SpoVT family DNA-binding domain-containing protein [Actinomycetota bacterium]